MGSPAKHSGLTRMNAHRCKFDLDQIQNRRALTIVNSGLALCETGATESAMNRFTVAVISLACTASAAFAQKYKTDIPSAIVTPDSVDTRLGTLKFKDGFPDDATVQKVYDNLDFQRGVQAFLTAMPAASLVA